MHAGGAAALTLDPGTGYLPRGRHRVTEQDIRARFVDHDDFAASTTRAAIWQDFEDVRDLLASRIRVHAYWLGGSFTTAKVDPGDIDVLFIVNNREYARADEATKKFVTAFGPLPGVTGRAHGLDRVESFLMHWRPWSPFAPGQPQASPEETTYALSRGYWDDWWQRDRYNKPDGRPLHWRDAVPVRGYLEVELSAFAA